MARGEPSCPSGCGALVGAEELIVMAMPVEAESVTVSPRPPRKVHFENSLLDGPHDQVELFIDDECNLDRAVKDSGATFPPVLPG